MNLRSPYCVRILFFSFLPRKLEDTQLENLPEILTVDDILLSWIQKDQPQISGVFLPTPQNSLAQT